jgi:hypothetical protein
VCYFFTGTQKGFNVIGKDLPQEITSIDLTRCPCCHNGTMIVVRDLPAWRECVWRWPKLTLKPHCALAVTKNLSAAISTFTHSAFYRYQSASLCTAAALYNPNSRGYCAAPRFSPKRSFDQAQDRFIPRRYFGVLSGA